MKQHLQIICDRKDWKIYRQAKPMLVFITEIQQALMDKKKGGTELSIQESSMLLTANSILKQTK